MSLFSWTRIYNNHDHFQAVTAGQGFSDFAHSGLYQETWQPRIFSSITQSTLSLINNWMCLSYLANGLQCFTPPESPRQKTGTAVLNGGNWGLKTEKVSVVSDTVQAHYLSSSSINSRSPAAGSIAWVQGSKLDSDPSFSVLFVYPENFSL